MKTPSWSTLQGCHLMIPHKCAATPCVREMVVWLELGQCDRPQTSCDVFLRAGLKILFSQFGDYNLGNSVRGENKQGKARLQEQNSPSAAPGSNSSRAQTYTCMTAGLQRQQGLTMVLQARLACSSRLRPFLSLKNGSKLGFFVPHSMLSLFLAPGEQWRGSHNVAAPPCLATQLLIPLFVLWHLTITSWKRQWLALRTVTSSSSNLRFHLCFLPCICLQTSLQSSQGNIKLSTQQSGNEPICSPWEQFHPWASHDQLVTLYSLSSNR